MSGCLGSSCSACSVPPWADSAAVTQAEQACRQAGKVEAGRPCLCWRQAQAPPALDSLLLESRKLEDSRQNTLYRKPEPSAKLGGQWWQVDRDHMGLRQLIRTAHLGQHHTLCPRQTQTGLWLLLLSPVSSDLEFVLFVLCPSLPATLGLRVDVNTGEFFSASPFIYVQPSKQPPSCSYNRHS